MRSHPKGDPKGAESPAPKKHQTDEDIRDEELREEGMDKTLADSFPASDPPSSIPDPGDEEEKDAA
jgi:hypothetical protein